MVGGSAREAARRCRRLSLRLDILAVGRLRDPAAEALVERYRARLPWKVRVLEIEARGSPDVRRRLAKEGEQLLRAARGAFLTVLDERGETPDSRRFAERLRRLADGGRSRIAFVVGGPDGVSPEIRERADWLLSLGPMTWPHTLVRVMLLEQLWRASSLIAGHPYHRD